HLALVPPCSATPLSALSLQRRSSDLVSAEEVNEVSDWLADLTAENDLPQKVFVLHQFSASMISDREDIDASSDELAVLFHADGQDRKSTRLNSSHVSISYAVFCSKKK